MSFSRMIKTKFLWLPKRLPHPHLGIRTWKWLTTANVERILNGSTGKWQDVAWSVAASELGLPAAAKPLTLRGLRFLWSLLRGWWNGRTHSQAVVTVAFIALTDANDVLLVKRESEPFKGSWMLPCGFLEPSERVREGCLRELREKTGLDRADLVSVSSAVLLADAPGRDPRQRVVTIAAVGQVRSEQKALDSTKWMSVALLDSEQIAFDHKNLIRKALEVK